MSVLDTGQLDLPDQKIDPWLGQVKFGSTVATLTPSIPMKFGAGQAMTFDTGEAEFVGEGQNKGPSDYTSTTQRVEPFKFHKTVRFTDEVLWADEDYQLGVVDQILAAIAPALARALDFGVFHGINPTGGAEVAAMTQRLSATENAVTLGDGLPALTIDAADALVLAHRYIPNSIAIDVSWAGALYSTRNAAFEAGDGQGPKTYPDFTLSTAASVLEGHRSSVSDTVGAVGVAEKDTNIAGFVGDFSAIRWGIQRSIGLELIEFGDPDGQGDLKRNNQVAFRAEVVYGWGIADLNAFAKVNQAGDTPEP
jgi:hypothetical protein